MMDITVENDICHKK